jgi:exopolysaccharide production protein ExoQ
VSFKPTRRELYSVCMLAVIGGAIAAMFAYMYGFDDTVARGAAAAAARGKLVIGDQSSNPNGLAEALTMPLALAIGAFLGSRRMLQRAIAMAFLLMIGLGVYISMSRSGILAVAVIVGVFLYRFRANRQIVIQILMVVAILVALTATMPTQFYDRIAIVFSGDDATGSGRTDIWQVAIEAIKRFGLFGAGLENFVDVHQLYVPHGPLGYAFGAHNSYLMVWVELGIVGLVLMLSALYCHLRATAKLKRRDRTIVTLEAASMAVLVAAFFGDIIWTKLFWWPWILLTWAIRTAGTAPDSATSRRDWG